MLGSTCQEVAAPERRFTVDDLELAATRQTLLEALYKEAARGTRQRLTVPKLLCHDAMKERILDVFEEQRGQCPGEMSLMLRTNALVLSGGTVLCSCGERGCDPEGMASSEFMRHMKQHRWQVYDQELRTSLECVVRKAADGYWSSGQAHVWECAICGKLDSKEVMPYCCSCPATYHNNCHKDAYGCGLLGGGVCGHCTQETRRLATSGPSQLPGSAREASEGVTVLSEGPVEVNPPVGLTEDSPRISGCQASGTPQVQPVDGLAAGPFEKTCLRGSPASAGQAATACDVGTPVLLPRTGATKDWINGREVDQGASAKPCSPLVDKPTESPGKSPLPSQALTSAAPEQLSLITPEKLAPKRKHHLVEQDEGNFVEESVKGNPGGITGGLAGNQTVKGALEVERDWKVVVVPAKALAQLTTERHGTAGSTLMVSDALGPPSIRMGPAEFCHPHPKDIPCLDGAFRAAEDSLSKCWDHRQFSYVELVWNHELMSFAELLARRCGLLKSLTWAHEALGRQLWGELVSEVAGMDIGISLGRFQQLARPSQVALVSQVFGQLIHCCAGGDDILVKYGLVLGWMEQPPALPHAEMLCMLTEVRKSLVLPGGSPQSKMFVDLLLSVMVMISHGSHKEEGP